jgi:murein DD-endopeptidase MepM/ murein hydrolase activator NlpD
MVLTQPFGVDYLKNGGPGGKSYADIGLKDGHNGWDISCPSGTEVYACMDGELLYTDNGTGYGRDVRIRNKERGIEVVYGHLEKSLVPNGRVKEGDLIALSDNTGFSTGPHLHFGLRRIYYEKNGAGPYVLNYDNGYFGYVDPATYFPADLFALPVDRQYGLTNQTKGVPSEWEWQKTNIWFFTILKRLMTTRERNALRYGFWDVRTVLDPAMFPTWSEMTKPEAKKRGIIK